MEIDKEIYYKALKMAMEVGFLDKNDFMRYVTVIYNAFMWGKQIDKENKKIQKGGVR